MCFSVFQILSEFRCSPSCTRGLVLGSEPVCPPDCFQYKGTLDVFLKVVRQVTSVPSLLYFLF
jgi:solute carrier family 25 protein 39/40